jgi:thioredoxin reductase (NADPH)
MITLTLYSRPECHLCATMHAELVPLLRGRARVTIVDIDADRDLERRYGERIPVLTAGNAELCCIRLDAARVEHYLSAAD